LQYYDIKIINFSIAIDR
jgi:hypothetical protein